MRRNIVIGLYSGTRRNIVIGLYSGTRRNIVIGHYCVIPDLIRDPNDK